MSEAQANRRESNNSSTMDYYVTHDGEIEMGAFDTESEARDKAMEEASQRIKDSGDTSFGEGFRIQPEWRCINDPHNNWQIHHITMDNYYALTEYDVKWEVGVFDSEHKVVDGMVTTHQNFGEALAALCWYLSQTMSA